MSEVAASLAFRVNSHLRQTWRLLRRDPVFWGLTPALAMVIVLTVFPILSGDWAEAWGDTFANLTLYGVATTAVFAGTAAIPSKRERLFWRMVCFPMAAITAVYSVWAVTWIWFPDLLDSPVWDLATQGIYLVFYIGFSLAIDSVSIAGRLKSARMLRWMRSVGLGVMLAGILMYLSVVPTVYYSDYVDSWPPLLLTYAALDVVICLRFLKTRANISDSRWRGILGWMALAFGAWAIVDMGEAALYLGLFGAFETIPAWELQWYLPIAIFVVGARIHIGHPRPHRETPPTKHGLLIGAGPLLGYALSIPLAHLVLYNTSIPAPELRSLRDAVVLVVLGLVGVIALMYQVVIERENRAAHQGLKESRERYQSFVTASVEGVWLVEFRPPISIDLPEGEQLTRIYRQAHVAEANNAMARMFEYEDATQILGKPLRAITGLVQNNEANYTATRKFVRDGYQTINEMTEHVGRDGITRYYEGSVSGIVANGFLRSAWGTQVDVTQRELERHEKMKLQHQLLQSQKMETIGTLAGGIAHDFNNMLSPILGFSELALVTTAPGDTKTRGYLEKINKSATRAKGLVDQILTVSRRQDGKRDNLDLKDLINEVIGLMRPSVPTSIDIKIEADSGCPSIVADAAQIHQVVMNLCTNAYQAISPNRGEILLELRDYEVSDHGSDTGLPVGRYAALTVSDDGPGMSPEAVARAFEPFYTTKGVGEGTGLGLSMVHGIVKSHAGRVTIESNEGEGTRVTVYLPTAVAAPEDRGREARRSGKGETTGRILLVDDEPDLLELGVAVLEKAGYQVHPIGHPDEACQALQRDPGGFDLLLTDYTMPSMTGPQLAEFALALNDRIAVLITSGYRLGQLPGANSEFPLLTKPYTGAELLNAVADALSREPTGAPPGPPVGP